MIIKDVLDQLEAATQPVAKLIHKGDKFKVLIIGFKSGMKLKEHIAPLPSKLTVISGNVMYAQEGKQTDLRQYDEIDIPVNIIHSVEAKENSLCLLTQG